MEEKKPQEPGATSENMPAWCEAFLYFLMLGFINIGGPVAQL
jgi:chromate transport protein ChrA